MSNIPLSILVTAYNREKFIGQAIQSVLNSTYTNFELIIVDDASTDDTVSVARQFEFDSRVKVFVNNQNLGQFENRNFAASLATGVYIKYLDSDDILYPFSLAIMMEAMLRYPDAALGICEKYRETSQPYPFVISPVDAIAIHYLKRELLMIGPSGTIMKRLTFCEVGGFENYAMPSDNHLTLKLAAKFPTVMLQRDLFWWRQHHNQVTTKNINNFQNIFNNYLFNTDILLRYSPLSSRDNKQIIRNQKKIFFVNLYKIIFKKGKLQTGISLYRQYILKKKV